MVSVWQIVAHTFVGQIILKAENNVTYSVIHTKLWKQNKLSKHHICCMYYWNIADWLIDWLTDWWLTPTLAVFQLYRGFGILLKMALI